MARFLAYDIKWKVLYGQDPFGARFQITPENIGTHSMVWLPGYMAGVIDDDREAVAEKLEADFNAIPEDFKLILIDHLAHDGKPDFEMEYDEGVPE